MFSGISSLSALQLAQLFRYSGWVLMGLVLTRLNMPIAQLAVPEYALFLSSFLSFFWVSGLVQYWLSTAPQPDKPDEILPRLLFWVFVGTLTAGAISLGIAYVRGLPMLPLLLFVSAIPIGALLDMLLYVRGKRRQLLLFSIGYALLQVLLPAAAWWYFQQEEAVLWAMGAVAATKALYCLWESAFFRQLSFSPKTHLGFLLSASPLLLSFFLSGLPEFSDAYIVQHFLGAADFVRYRYGAREFPVMMLVSATFSTAMVLAVARNLSAGLQDIRHQSARLMHIFFPVSAVLMFLSPVAYPFFFNNDFYAAAQVFNVYLLLAIPRLVFPQAVLNGIKKQRIILYSAASELLLNIIFSILLLKIMGLAGVALGTVLAYIADKLFLSGYLYFKQQIAPADYIPLRLYGLYSLLLAAAFICQHLLFFY